MPEQYDRLTPLMPSALTSDDASTYAMSSLRATRANILQMETWEPGIQINHVAGFRRNYLVPCSVPDCTCSVVLTKLCVKIHNFAHQPFDQLLADRTVLAAS